MSSTSPYAPASMRYRPPLSLFGSSVTSPARPMRSNRPISPYCSPSFLFSHACSALYAAPSAALSGRSRMVTGRWKTSAKTCRMAGLDEAPPVSSSRGDEREGEGGAADWRSEGAICCRWECIARARISTTARQSMHGLGKRSSDFAWPLSSTLKRSGGPLSSGGVHSLVLRYTPMWLLLPGGWFSTRRAKSTQSPFANSSLTLFLVISPFE
mmetsp:Transcript_2528/g.6673  ORF Transcript_2528/g.6673 Transcript_2528/m.6673 type:complete len:212 (-) Transcript_2528:1153-1788(-)